MEKQLVNVRLDPERLRKVRKLRQSGIALSDLVREAVDQRYASLRASPEPGAVRRALAQILQRHPDDPAPVTPRGYDVADAQQARAAIRRSLRRGRA